LSTRILTVGDIHGCFEQLEALLDAVQPTTGDHIVLLGDLVDRGPDSARVIDRVIKLAGAHRVTTIMGNHEQMMLAARASHDAYSDWLRNGGDATLRSYNGARATLRDIRAEHWKFLETQLVDYLETDTHIFVHANAYPDMAMSEQPDYMLRWERCDQIAEHQSGRVIVCGHTPQKSGRPLNRGFAICLDTNACGGGPLTCMEVIGGRVWQAESSGSVRRGHISDFDEG
jgi:serine/threonine protein phosphatase 1